MPFFKSLTRELINEGHTVDFAANQTSSRIPDYYREWGCKVYDISCSRSPFSWGNIKAINQIRQLAKDYDIVHCHTPLASMATRFACRKLRKQELKVIYTAHGFHFYKGAPLKNWLIYYPIEKICSRWTDVLITINKEDYQRAQKKLKAKDVKYVPGVGIDVERFAKTTVDRDKKLSELGVPADAIVILSVGELNKNKNHQVVVKALGKIKNPKIHYLIAGDGDQKDHLEKLAKKLNVNVHLLGYRRDVAELYKVADLLVHPSFREGLPVALMEAMANGLQIVASEIRGSRDFFSKDKNKLCSPKDATAFSKAIIQAIATSSRADYPMLEQLDKRKVNKKIISIYNSLFHLEGNASS